MSVIYGTEWIRSPVCGSKTRDKIREDTVLKNYPLCGIVKYLTKRHLNVNPSVKRWEMTGNPDKSRVVANLNGKK